jgi:hypothetical protein
MQDTDRKTIKAILGELGCSKDFKCAAHGFEKLCKARDFGLDGYLECLDEDRFNCPFALSFGDKYLCQCPMRVYLAKKLQK